MFGGLAQTWGVEVKVIQRSTVNIEFIDILLLYAPPILINLVGWMLGGGAGSNMGGQGYPKVKGQIWVFCRVIALRATYLN